MIRDPSDGSVKVPLSTGSGTNEINALRKKSPLVSTGTSGLSTSKEKPMPDVDQIGDNPVQIATEANKINDLMMSTTSGLAMPKKPEELAGIFPVIGFRYRYTDFGLFPAPLLSFSGDLGSKYNQTIKPAKYCFRLDLNA